jgi:hypothetical protein
MFLSRKIWGDHLSEIGVVKIILKWMILRCTVGGVDLIHLARDWDVCGGGGLLNIMSSGTSSSPLRLPLRLLVASQVSLLVAVVEQINRFS